MSVRLRHKKHLVRFWETLCFGLKYLFLLPQTWLEIVLRSPYKYPVVSHLQMLKCRQWSGHLRHLDVSVVCREGSLLKCHPATWAGLGGKGIKRAAERLAAVMSRLLMSSNLATGCDELEVNGVEEGRCLSPKWQLTAAGWRTDLKLTAVTWLAQ